MNHKMDQFAANSPESTETIPQTHSWGVPLTSAACTRCQAVFFIHSAEFTSICPRCLHKTLTLLESPQNVPAASLPELIIPFSTQQSAITQAVEKFTARIPYPPLDLTAENILKRLQPHYLSAWLVDVEIDADWHSEMGFDYQVVSHQDRFDQSSNRWISHEIKETRINWEPRLGKLSRSYHNTFAAALEDEGEIRQTVGNFDLSSSIAYQPELLPTKAFIELPNRSTEDAWNDAVVNLHSLAAEDCRKAGAADHIRNFRWNPEYKQKNWTLLLRPTFSSYYLDDNRQPHKITIHGNTGAIHGSRIASKQRAQSRALTMMIIAAAVFFIGLLVGAVGLLIPPILILAGLLLFASIAVAIGAVIPLAQVWQFNRQMENQKVR